MAHSLKNIGTPEELDKEIEKQNLNQTKKTHTYNIKKLFRVSLFTSLIIMWVALFPSLFMDWGYLDEAIYGAIAKSINSGLLLYTDVWDHHQPGLYIIYTILYKLFGDNLFFYKLTNIICLSGAIFFLHKIIQFLIIGALTNKSKFLNSKQIQNIQKNIVLSYFLLSVFLGLAIGTRFETYIFNTESLMILLSTALTYTLLKTHRLIQNEIKESIEKNNLSKLKQLLKNRDFLHLIISACGLIAMMSFTKLHSLLESLTLIFLFTVILILTYNRYHKLSNKDYLKSLLTILTITSLPMVFSIVAPYIIYFLIRITDFKEVYYSIFTYNFSYGGKEAWYLTRVFKIFIGIVFCSILYITYRFKKINIYTVLSGVWLISVIIIASATNRIYPHYFLQFIPPLIIFLACLSLSITANIASLRVNICNTTTQFIKLFAVSFLTIVLIKIFISLPIHPFKFAPMRYSTQHDLYPALYEFYKTKDKTIFDKRLEEKGFYGKEIVKKIENKYIDLSQKTYYNLTDYISIHVNLKANNTSKYLTLFHIEDLENEKRLIYKEKQDILILFNCEKFYKNDEKCLKYNLDQDFLNKFYIKGEQNERLVVYYKK